MDTNNINDDLKENENLANEVIDESDKGTDLVDDISNDGLTHNDEIENDDVAQNSDLRINESESVLEDVATENEEIPEDNASYTEIKPKKRLSKKTIIGIAVAILAIIVIAVVSSIPRVTSLSVSYKGDTKEGVVLDESNPGFTVVGKTKDGKNVDITGKWTIAEPKTLKMDEKATVTVLYKKISVDYSVTCSTSAVTRISVTYNGSDVAGTKIDNNANFKVIEQHKNGTVTDGKWEVLDPTELVADTTSEVTIKCGEFTETVSIKCSTSALVSISAKYSGSREEGVVIKRGVSGLVVEATYKNGETKEIKDYTVEKAKKLQAGKTSTVVIQYEDKEYSLEVECSTLSQKQYMDKCKEYSYEELARNPSKYEGKLIKMKGGVLQTGDFFLSMDYLRVATKYGYSRYTDDVIFVKYYPDENARILEDDVVTVYGEFDGLYSYETVMGATLTIPSITAKYVVLD